MSGESVDKIRISSNNSFITILLMGTLVMLVTCLQQFIKENCIVFDQVAQNE